MAKDHYIPASLLGRFSQEEKGRRRFRKIWALERSTADAQNIKAQGIAALKDFYDLYMTQHATMSRLVDDSWRHYESLLPDVLDQLEYGRDRYVLDAHTWLTVLVPYVASLFVRGPDFNLRFEARPGMKAMYKHMSSKEPHYPRDNTNFARLIEFQRLLAPIMAAHWEVLHTTEDSPFIINERGYTFFGPAGKEIQGWFIPVGRLLAFTVAPIRVNGFRAITVDKGLAHWRAILNHRDISASDVYKFNRAIAGVASDFIAGPNEESVARLREELGHDPLPPEYFYYNSPPPAVLRRHEHAMHYLLTKIKLAAIDKRLRAELQPPNSFILNGMTITFRLSNGEEKQS